MSTYSERTRKELRQVYRTVAKEFSDSRSQPWQEFERFAELIEDGDSVLDLGCGNGRFYHYLVSHSGKQIDYTGVDFCPEFLAIAKERYPKATFVEQDISALDLDQNFDVIACIAAFHHLPTLALRKKTLKRIFSQLDDHGTLLVSVWNLWQWRYAGAHLRAWLKWLTSGFRSDPRGTLIPFGKQKLKRYYHAFFSFELKRLLNQAGFRVDHFELSRHNYLFICHKRMAAATPETIRHHHQIHRKMKAPAVATSHFHRS